MLHLNTMRQHRPVDSPPGREATRGDNQVPDRMRAASTDAALTPQDAMEVATDHPQCLQLRTEMDDIQHRPTAWPGPPNVYGPQPTSETAGNRSRGDHPLDVMQLEMRQLLTRRTYLLHRVDGHWVPIVTDDLQHPHVFGEPGA